MTTRLSAVRSLIAALAIASAMASPLYAQSVAATLTSTTCPGAGCLQINASGFGSVIVQINDPQSGTWQAVAEANNDATGSFKTLTGTSSDGTTTATSWTASNIFIVAGGSSAVRVRLSSWSSGAPLVTLRVSPASPPANVSASVSGNPAASATGSAVPASASYTGVRIGTNLVGQTGFTVGSTNAAAVQIVDNTGTPIVSFGGGSQFTNGAVVASGSVIGTVCIGYDGANVRACNTDTSGHLQVAFASTPLVNAAQSGTWNVANTGTFATQAAQSGTWTVQPGNTANTTPWLVTSRIVGNAGAVLDFAGQNATSPANAQLMGGQFNTTPTTITSGNSSPLQLDANGNLLVNIKAGAGSGGTALADGGAFTAGSTNTTPASGFYQSSPTTCTTGTACAVGITTNREFKVALTTMLDQPGGTSVMDTTAHAVKVSIAAGGSNAVTDAGTQTAGASSVATTDSYQFAYNGSTYGRVFLDACNDANATISTVSFGGHTTGFVLKAGTSAKKTSICGLNLVSTGAESYAIVEGTGTVCATGTAAVLFTDTTTPTAANGVSVAANGGVNGQPTTVSIATTATNADDLCLLKSGSGAVSGWIKVAVR